MGIKFMQTLPVYDINHCNMGSFETSFVLHGMLGISHQVQYQN